MKKGRSIYSINFNCDFNTINTLVQNYLSINGFKLIDNNGEKYYRAGDVMVQGYRYFNYSITGNIITISAWLKGVFGEIEIEQNGVTSINIPIMNYRNSLNTLFQEIEKLNLNNSSNNTINNVNSTIDVANENNLNVSQNSSSQFVETFQNENVKKQEKMCEIGFWISIVGLFVSFLGAVYGLVVYVMIYYFAIQGLKTKKRKKAIASIVITTISILISILALKGAFE